MRPASPTRHPRDPGGYLLALVGTVVGIGVAALAEWWMGIDDLSLVFMLVVLLVAARTHAGPAALTAVLCFLAYNFFFIEPRYSLYIHAPRGIATVVLFLAAALIAGRMAARLAMQVEALQIAGKHAATRQELSRRLSVATTEQDILQAAQAAIDASLDADTWFRLEAPHDAQVRIGGVAQDHGWWFLPLQSQDDVLGTVGIKLRDPAAAINDEERTLARTMVDDVAQALLRVRLAAALETERMEVERERLRSALLSSVSHDLRTPLSAMIGAGDTLALYGDSMDDADRNALVDTIREEGRRLERFIRNLLDMTRVGHGISPQRDWIGVDELLGAAIGRLQHTRHDVRVDVAVANDIGPIWVQPALIEQALFNLLDNAASFSPPGVPIVVDARLVDALDGVRQLRIEVTDQGPGIPPDVRERVFDFFYSVARRSRTRRHGPGSCDLPGHGRRAWRDRRRARRPRRPGHDDAHHAAVACARQRSDDVNTGARILVIDDEPQIRRFLDISLRAQGYQVLHAADARTGVDTLATQPVDAVILDLGLPDLDGRQVLAELRQWSQVPLLVLTARDDEAEKVAALDAGANDYVTKPFGVQELMARLRALLRTHAMQDGEQPPIFDDGTLRVDLARREVMLRGAVLVLSRKEYALLALLVRHAGRVVTQQQLLREIWGPTHQQDAHYLRVLVAKLRQRLGDDASRPTWLVTEPGVGLRFREK